MVPLNTILHFVVFLVLLYSYPDDESKSDQNMLVMNNVIEHVSISVVKCSWVKCGEV